MADKAMHMVEVVSNDCKMKETKKVDCTVLDYFTRIRSDTESDRIEGGIALLKYLLQQSSVSVYLTITSKHVVFSSAKE